MILLKLLRPIAYISVYRINLTKLESSFKIPHNMNKSVESRSEYSQEGWSKDLLPSARKMVTQAIVEGDWRRRLHAGALNSLVAADMTIVNTLNTSSNDSSISDDRFNLNQISSSGKIDADELRARGVAGAAALLGGVLLYVNRRRANSRKLKVITNRQGLRKQQLDYNRQIDRERRDSAGDPVWRSELNEAISNNRLEELRQTNTKPRKRRRRWLP